jgi:hypothetical protein
LLERKKEEQKEKITRRKKRSKVDYKGERWGGGGLKMA